MTWAWRLQLHLFVLTAAQQHAATTALHGTMAVTRTRPASWGRRLKLLLIATVLQYAAATAVHVDVPAPGPAGFADTDPDFTGPIHNITVAVGREAVLSCSVTDLGQYKVGWMKAEDQTILSLHTRVVTHNSRISVVYDNLRTWQLRIRQLKESDRGCYMCQINTSTMKKQFGCIDVQVPPDIDDVETSSDVTVWEGENVTLSCRATGHPPPRILWRREDSDHLVLRKTSGDAAIKVDTFSGDNLTLLKLDRKQMGAYLCIASNDVPPAVSKRITLNVNFAPIIKVPNQLLGAPLGTDVQLECFVEAYPNTINYWVNNQGEMLINGSKHVMSEERNGYKVHFVLVIRDFSRDDLGTYMCVAKNSLGRVEGTIRLYEIKVQTTPPSTTSTTSLAPTWATEWTSLEPIVESVSSVAPVEALREEPPSHIFLTHAPPSHEYMETYSLSPSAALTPTNAFLLLLLLIPCVR